MTHEEHGEEVEKEEVEKEEGDPTEIGEDEPIAGPDEVEAACKRLGKNKLKAFRDFHVYIKEKVHRNESGDEDADYEFPKELDMTRQDWKDFRFIIDSEAHTEKGLFLTTRSKLTHFKSGSCCCKEDESQGTWTESASRYIFIIVLFLKLTLSAKPVVSKLQVGKVTPSTKPSNKKNAKESTLDSVVKAVLSPAAPKGKKRAKQPVMDDEPVSKGRKKAKKQNVQEEIDIEDSGSEFLSLVLLLLTRII